MKNPNSADRTKTAALQIQNAIQEVPLACTGNEIADAILINALTALEACNSKDEIAEGLLLLADGYLRPVAQPKTETQDPGPAFLILNHANTSLTLNGYTSDTPGRLMLSYASQMLARADSNQAAQMLYALADDIATNEMTSVH